MEGRIPAITQVRKASKKSYWVVDIDIKGYFDNINHRKLMLLVGQKISDKRVLKLIRNWLKAGVMEEGNLEVTEIGSPQGGVISPLLANIYLNVLDHLWEKRYKHLGDLVRYADDMVVMTKTKRDAMPRNRLYWDTLDFIPDLNRKIRGLKNYYDISVMAVKWLARIDWYIRERLLLHYNKRRTNQNKRSNWKTVKELLDGKLLKLA
jgi:retron-type reverse transcriptase